MQSLPQENILWTHLAVEKTHMHGAKESCKRKYAHSRVRKSLTKQNCFKKHHLERKHCYTAHVAHKPVSMEWGIHNSPTWTTASPPRFNKAFVTSKQQYWHVWLQITNCLSRKLASMAQCSRRDAHHRYPAGSSPSCLPSSMCHPAQRAFKLERSD